MVSGLEEIGIRDDEEPTLIFIPPISTRLLAKQREAYAAQLDVHDDDDDETIVHGSIREVTREVEGPRGGAATRDDIVRTREPTGDAAPEPRRPQAEAPRTINGANGRAPADAPADAEAATAATAAAAGETAAASAEAEALEPAPADSARSMLLNALTPDVMPSAPQMKPRDTRRTPVILLEQPIPEPGKTDASRGVQLVQWLSKIPLFRGMHTRYIDRIARLGIEERYPAGSFIFHHGDHGEDLYILLEGTLQVLRTIEEVGEESLAQLRPGHHFGEMSFLDSGARRSADIRVRHAARVLRLPMRPLRDLMFVDRDLAHDLLWRFVRDLTRRVRDSNNRLSMLVSSSRF